MQFDNMLLAGGKEKEAIEHLEAAVRLTGQADYIQHQSRGRLPERIPDRRRDGELRLYKEIGVKSGDAHRATAGRAPMIFFCREPS